MHSAKISDQKITKISKHQDSYAGGYGQRRSNGSDPGNSRLSGDPFNSPLPQGSCAEPYDNLGGPFPRDTHKTLSQDSETSNK